MSAPAAGVMKGQAVLGSPYHPAAGVGNAPYLVQYQPAQQAAAPIYQGKAVPAQLGPVMQKEQAAWQGPVRMQSVQDPQMRLLPWQKAEFPQAPAAAAAPAKPEALHSTLWALECTFSEGLKLGALPKASRSLLHHGERTGPLAATLRVGRLFQEAFFKALVAQDDVRALVGREHFQIWAEEEEKESPKKAQAASKAAPAERLCSFFLTNFSPHGTIVNGVLLQQGGEQVPLHGGDTIGLPRPRASLEDRAVPFLEFRFDLTGSVLKDANASRARRAVVSPAPAAGAVGEPQTPLPPARTVPSVASLHSGAEAVGAEESNPLRHLELELKEPLAGRQASGQPFGINFLGVELRPLFALELGGTGLQASIGIKERCILHGPVAVPQPGFVAVQKCPPLVVDCADQAPYWRKLLTDAALATVASTQFMLKACLNSGFEVRNLGPAPLLLRRSGDGEGPDVHPDSMEPNQTRRIQQGDVIIMSAVKGATLWLMFRELGGPPAAA